MMDVIGGASLIAGSVLILLAAVGAVRFDDIYARMHAAAKAPALGVLLIGLGAATMIRTTPAMVALGLVVVLQLVTSPVGAHLLGRAVYHGQQPELDGIDELAAARPLGDDQTPETAKPPA
jgi:multicomponent Na+:H+ antiporter subunit G